MGKRRHRTCAVVVMAVIAVALQMGACAKKETPRGKNLLVNASFEEVDKGLPEGWRIDGFRGLEGEQAATYQVDDSVSYDGQRSFRFSAKSGAKRFFMLTQEIELVGVARVHLQGAIRTRGVIKESGQYPQANFAVSYYDESHARFSSARFADAGTKFQTGSSDGWIKVERSFKLPENTRYVAVHCVLGMTGDIWFDALSLEVPAGLPWQVVQGEIFTHHWLEGSPYPEGSIAYQKEIHDYYVSRLGIPQDGQEPVSYYLYPDSTTFREALSVSGDIYVDYDRREIHSINPVDRHEIVHLLTDVYGRLPTMLGEGTAFYLMDDFAGERIHPLAQRILREGDLPSMRTILDPFATSIADPQKIGPAAASFVGFLLEGGSTERFLELHRRYVPEEGYEGFARVFGEVYGDDLQSAETAWRKILTDADFSDYEESASEKRDQQE